VPTHTHAQTLLRSGLLRFPTLPPPTLAHTHEPPPAFVVPFLCAQVPRQEGHSPVTPHGDRRPVRPAVRVFLLPVPSSAWRGWGVGMGGDVEVAKGGLIGAGVCGSWSIVDGRWRMVDGMDCTGLFQGGACMQGPGPVANPLLLVWTTGHEERAGAAGLFHGHRRPFRHARRPQHRVRRAQGPAVQVWWPCTRVPTIIRNRGWCVSVRHRRSTAPLPPSCRGCWCVRVCGPPADGCACGPLCPCACMVSAPQPCFSPSSPTTASKSRCVALWGTCARPPAKRAFVGACVLVVVVCV
jgi:hypothetical protein